MGCRHSTMRNGDQEDDVVRTSYDSSSQLPTQIPSIYTTLGETDHPHHVTIPKVLKSEGSRVQFEIELTSTETFTVRSVGANCANARLLENANGQKIALIKRHQKEYQIYSVDSPSFESQEGETFAGFRIYLYASFHLENRRFKDCSPFLIQKAHESAPSLVLDPFTRPGFCYVHRNKIQNPTTVAKWMTYGDQLRLTIWSDDHLFIVCLAIISSFLREASTANGVLGKLGTYSSSSSSSSSTFLLSGAAAACAI